MVDESGIPASFQPLYTAAQIKQQVALLGKQIDTWAAEVWRASHTDILTIPILRGGIFFFADLVREIPHSIEIAPARAWAYEEDKTNVQKANVKVNVSEVPARGRAVLLVDDICDSGRTMHAMKEALLEAGAQTVKSAVLVRREVQGQTFTPDWVGFELHGSDWLVGYGMDDCDRWRNLAGIYVIKQALI